MTTASEIAFFLDDLLGTDRVPDYPGAFNGLQLDRVGPVRKIAASVDVSLRSIELAIADGANLLIVHHGMFWSGTQRLVGLSFQRLRMLIGHELAVYSSHLPLDAHPALGNNVLLANALGLVAEKRFGLSHGIFVGVAGQCDVSSLQLLDRVQQAVAPWGGSVRSSFCSTDRRSRSWGICTGAGASLETLREAAATGIDTLIVGEGPHHTAVDAPDMGLVVIYAGHYATETLGVQALARASSEHFGIPWQFVHVTGGL